MLGDKGESRDTLGIGLAAGLALAFLALSGAVLAQEIDALKPGVGDIIDFHADGRVSQDAQSNFRVQVNLSDVAVKPSKTCVLDIHTMLASRGSIVVEAREEPSLYRVHWAGGATSPASSNCGNASEFLVNAETLVRLANMVGGFGVHDTRQPMLRLQESIITYAQ